MRSRDSPKRLSLSNSSKKINLEVVVFKKFLSNAVMQVIVKIGEQLSKVKEWFIKFKEKIVARLQSLKERIEKLRTALLKLYERVKECAKENIEEVKEAAAELKVEVKAFLRDAKELLADLYKAILFVLDLLLILIRVPDPRTR